jgi:putative spermidine/putrescine transport system permease protein
MQQSAALRYKVAWAALTLMALLMFVFLLAPILVIVPLAFNAGNELSFPLTGFSFRWFEEFFSSQSWVGALENSLAIGAGTTVVSVVIGTAASLGFWGLRGPMRSIVRLTVLAPLVVPTVIVGAGMYFVFSSLGLTETYLGLVLAHATLALPFQFVTTTAALANLDQRQLWAAASMGAGPMRRFASVTLPIALPGILTGALFSFATSFDEIVVTLFLSGPGQRTLPREMFTAAKEFLTPTIAAAATLMIGVSIIFLVVFLTLRSRGGGSGITD